MIEQVTGVRQKIAELIVSGAYLATKAQNADGSLSEGHNGPYQDVETRARNTAHWCISFLSAWQISGDRVFREAARRAVDYLLSPVVRPCGGAFFCRNSPSKDQTNGLVGQAWVIEALSQAGVKLERSDACEVAANVFRLHRYENREGGWRRAKLDGGPGDFDRVFNHQLWFCASGAMLATAGSESIELEVRDFIKRLPQHMKFYKSGLIRHINARFMNESITDKLIAAARWLRNAKQYSSHHSKSVGYHAFNTYAFAMIDRALPSLELAKKEPVAKALKYLVSKDYANSVESSRYGFPYNPPGFELAVSVDTFFPAQQDLVDKWLNRQLEETYDPETGFFDRNVADTKTSAARLYEVSRLFDQR